MVNETKLHNALGTALGPQNVIPVAATHTKHARRNGNIKESLQTVTTAQHVTLNTCSVGAGCGNAAKHAGSADVHLGGGQQACCDPKASRATPTRAHRSYGLQNKVVGVMEP